MGPLTRVLRAQMTTRLRVTGDAAGPFRAAAQVLLCTRSQCLHSRQARA